MKNNELLSLYTTHNGKVSDKWNLYLTTYNEIFESFKNLPINILEIGIQNGGSIEIWANYFKKAQQFVGCDINRDCGRLKFNDTRINIVVGDATDSLVREEIEKRFNRFDIIIEDGSHTSKDIVTAFQQYFPLLHHGGIFVFEDLHCSYWQEYQGGIYYPFSSINFFKRLADSINIEHWGIGKSRRDNLIGFENQYGITFNEDELAQIHSVTFVNSMCIIKKLPWQSNQLGKRIIAGCEELVVSGHLRFQGEQITAFNQESNPWANRTTPADEACYVAEKKILLYEEQNAKQKAAIDALQRELRHVLQSRSWRITKPFRYLWSLFRS